MPKAKLVTSGILLSGLLISPPILGVKTGTSLLSDSRNDKSEKPRLEKTHILANSKVLRMFWFHQFYTGTYKNHTYYKSSAYFGELKILARIPTMELKPDLFQLKPCCCIQYTKLMVPTIRLGKRKIKVILKLLSFVYFFAPSLKRKKDNN
jgi:hypothetical protein